MIFFLPHKSVKKEMLAKVGFSMFNMERVRVQGQMGFNNSLPYGFFQMTNYFIKVSLNISKESIQTTSKLYLYDFKSQG